MRKFTGMLGAAAMLSILPATPALAEGAVIDKDSGICYGKIPKSDGTLDLTGPTVEGSLFIRANKSWTTMTCHFDLTDDQSPLKATHARGFTCDVPPHSTQDTRASASAGGRMVMTCRLPTP